jgi:septum formation protein
VTARVILASASPRRRELLAALIDDFEVVPADVPEELTDDGFADAARLSLAKAVEVASRYPDAVVIAADTVVYEGSKTYGKPAGAGDALAMWRALRGHPHMVATGVAVAAPALPEPVHATEASFVTLRDLSDAEVRHYIASGRPMDKAGAYAIQDEDVPTVDRLEGCYCSVMGLGLWALRDLLARAGIQSRDPSATFPRCAQTCHWAAPEPALRH